ncbi:MAG TPA: DUF378 domain-containing protein [Acidimicrobiales bacterium]|nr:DUF378 domain-containing protein [Acidimicrobiales bacterium]
MGPMKTGLRRKHSVMDDLNTADRVAGALLAAGALNWGLVGAANFDAIRATLGRSKAARAAYGLVGASAAYALARSQQLNRR